MSLRLASGHRRALRRLALGTAAFLTNAAAADAQRAAVDTTVKVTVGGFVDAYYAYDRSRPPSLDRSFAGGTPFTTQPTRHNEFNVNLAFMEVKLEGPRQRGRLAVQAGTSVQSNYAGEPTVGETSGASLSRHIQEAVVGVRVADAVWIDGGIYLSHMGLEGWISRDNATYTRSLVAEYSPYYQSGVKATWTASPRLTAQLNIVNGWQNISENNGGKGVGVRLDFLAAPATTFSYYNLFSHEAGRRLRTFNGIGVRHTAGSVTLIGQVDAGSQDESAADGGTATWYGMTAIARLQLTPRVAVSARAERFDDEHQVVLSTGNSSTTRANGPFRGNAASLGLDVVPQPRVLWRTELRGFSNREAVFPNGASGAPQRNGGFAVSSLALSF